MILARSHKESLVNAEFLIILSISKVFLLKNQLKSSARIKKLILSLSYRLNQLKEGKGTLIINLNNTMYTKIKNWKSSILKKKPYQALES